MAGRQMCQWDKDSCDDAGFLKIDLLGLGMLSAVEECVEQIARVRGETIDLSRIPLDDPPTYEDIQRADTVGAFQIESRAQMQSLLRTRPENLDDLTVQVALVRPGPIQGKAVHPYIDRRQQLREDPDFVPHADHPLLDEPLRSTFGVVVFQDQVLEVAMALAGFTVGEAEGLRRAMSRKRSHAALEAYRARFIEGATRKGVPETKADEIYDKLVGFSGFGFPKSHAAAFGLLAYQSSWLRRHYPAEFLAALLNAQPMGFYPPASLVRDAQRRGVEVLPPDVNVSAAKCVLEGEAVRVGLEYVQSVGADDAKVLVEERERGGAVPGDRRPRPARARGAGRAGGDRRRRRLRLVRRAAAQAPLAARARAALGDRSGHRWHGAAAGAAARSHRGDPRPAGTDTVGADAGRLRQDEPVGRRPSARAPAAPPAAGDALEPGARRGAFRFRGRRGGDGGRAPATGDSERRRLHAARGRARTDEPDHPAAGVRAVPADRARGAPSARARGSSSAATATRTSSSRELETLAPLASRVARWTWTRRYRAHTTSGTADVSSCAAWTQRSSSAAAV